MVSKTCSLGLLKIIYSLQMVVSYGYPPFDVCDQKLIPTSYDGEESPVFETLKTLN